LEKLTGLTSLNLRNNQISDVRPTFLENLTGLTSLDLKRTMKLATWYAIALFHQEKKDAGCFEGVV
jgi:hypothetical protein